MLSMVGKGISCQTCHAIYQYSTPNKKVIKNYNHATTKAKIYRTLRIETPAVYADDQCLNNYLLAILNGKKTSQSLMKSF